MIRLIPLFILMLSSLTSFGQTRRIPFGCQTMGEIKNTLPESKSREKNLRTPKTIRCVVHICHSPGFANSQLSNEVVQGAIDQMNVDFVGSNLSFTLEHTNYVDLREFSWHDAYATGGLCFPLYQTQATMIAKKYKWDTREYCNIYVVPKMCQTLLGYAYVLFGPSNENDGIWVLTSSFGYGNWPHLAPTLRENETLSHEMGHYCGLFHTFNETEFCGQQDSNIGCEYEGDYVCDTPPTKMSRGCPGVPGFFCPEVGYDGGVQFRANNHMDYCPEQCRDRFTEGQIDRMHRMLDFQRYELYTDEPATPFCLGDLNGDGAVGTSDLLVILSNYGCVECGYERGDIDLDQKVTVQDLNFLLSLWGDICGDGIGQMEGMRTKSFRTYADNEFDDPTELIANFDFPERGTPTKEEDREKKEEKKQIGLMNLTKKLGTTVKIKLEELDEIDLFGLFLESGIESLIVDINEDEKIVIERS